jgi:tetratricopeptide (TPR) repeat protein
LTKRGELDAALESLRRALDAEREYPSAQGTAYLDYAELVLRLQRTDLYEDALSHLDFRSNTKPLPIVQYRSGAAAAFLCEHSGRLEHARTAAMRALVAAAKTDAPFRYHRRIGLVGRTDSDELERLWRLAGQSA